MLTCENEQFHLLGASSLNALVKRVSEIYRQDDRISDGKKHLSYSLLGSSALSNEERKDIVRKFKSNQRKREIYNKYNDNSVTNFLANFVITIQHSIQPKTVSDFCFFTQT